MLKLVSMGHQADSGHLHDVFIPVSIWNRTLPPPADVSIIVDDVFMAVGVIRIGGVKPSRPGTIEAESPLITRFDPLGLSYFYNS